MIVTTYFFGNPKRYLMRAFFLISTVLTCIFSASAAQLEGRVVKVSDGDTITVLDSSKTQHRIRLTGIDAPEKKQAFGEKSRLSLAALVAGKNVTVHWDNKDRYNRILGKVITPDGKDANLLQIKNGMAWHYKQYSKTRPFNETSLYSSAEDKAKKDRIGLWVYKNPVAPWDWRKNK